MHDPAVVRPVSRWRLAASPMTDSAERAGNRTLARLARQVHPGTASDQDPIVGGCHVLGWRDHWTDPADPADPAAHGEPVSRTGITIHGNSRHRRRPLRRGAFSLLPDSLTTGASFTRGFPHYPNPNLPMALRSVVNRCANSEHMIGVAPFRGQRPGTKIPLHFRAVRTAYAGLSRGRASIRTAAMTTGSRGTSDWVVGTWPMASTTSVPPVTRPSTL